MNKKIVMTQNDQNLTVELSDAKIRDYRITLPSDIAGIYNLSTLQEFHDRFYAKNYIEISVSRMKINQNDDIGSFFEDKDIWFEIHRIFETNGSQNEPKYITSFILSP